MAIQDQITVELASVEVDDEYQIELRQHRRRVAYTPRQARDLGLELLHAADRVDELLRDDMRELTDRLTRAKVTTKGGEVVL